MIILICILSPVMARSGPLAERVTVTMPSELVAGIDRIVANRSRFIAEAVRHELQRRQRLELLRSLEFPIPTAPPLRPLAWRTGPRPCLKGTATCSIPAPESRCTGDRNRVGSTPAPPRSGHERAPGQPGAGGSGAHPGP